MKEIILRRDHSKSQVLRKKRYVCFFSCGPAFASRSLRMSRSLNAAHSRSPKHASTGQVTDSCAILGKLPWMYYLDGSTLITWVLLLTIVFSAWCLKIFCWSLLIVYSVMSGHATTEPTSLLQTYNKHKHLEKNHQSPEPVGKDFWGLSHLSRSFLLGSR